MTIGIDVGGTWIKLGWVEGKRLLAKTQLPTAPWARSPSDLEMGLVEAVNRFVTERKIEVRAIGIGIPGLVRYPEGVVDSCANLPGWHGVPLKARLMRRWKCPVWVDNDVNAMTLAEWRYGAGRGTTNLVCLTLGTGVGGGLVLNGELYRSRSGPSGEIGHSPLSEKGRRCSCGGWACLERYVGNREIVRQTRARLKAGERSILTQWVEGDLRHITPELLDQACRLGDPLARQIWRRVGERIGLVLVGVVNLLCPDRIVVGGGIAKAGRWLFEPMRQTLWSRSMRGLGRVPVVPAKLGVSAGVIGAALLAQEGLKREGRPR